MKQIIALFILASFAGLQGCGKSANAPATGQTNGPASEQQTLQLNWKPEPEFGGFYAAQQEGIYQRHGLNVAIRPGGPGTPTPDMLGAGTVDFAIIGGDEIIRARANGNKIVALFAVYQTDPHAIMTRAERGFTSLADIFSHEGTLALERGLPYADFLEKKYGFQKLRIVPSPFGDLSLYRTDPNYSMQCFITAEPFAANKIGIAPKTFLIADSGYNPYMTVLATTESYLHAHPQEVNKMIAAVREGWQSYLADPVKINQYMGTLNPTMSQETFAEAADAQKPMIQAANDAPLGSMTLERWQTLVQQLIDLKAIKQPIEAKEIYYEPPQSK
jgi:NitT/TauT family transport system substrate-binding protein